MGRCAEAPSRSRAKRGDSRQDTTAGAANKKQGQEGGMLGRVAETGGCLVAGLESCMVGKEGSRKTRGRQLVTGG